MGEGVVRKLTAGEALFHRDDPVGQVFVVIDGEVILQRHTIEGAAVIFQRAKAGETLAEASLFSEHYHCDAVAVTAAGVIAFSKNEVLKGMEADASFGREVLAQTSRKLIETRSRLELRNVRSARERILQYLVLVGGDGIDGITFDKSLKDVAAEIGLTHETFYRSLKKLEADGVIKRMGRMIRIIGDAG